MLEPVSTGVLRKGVLGKLFVTRGVTTVEVKLGVQVKVLILRMDFRAVLDCGFKLLMYRVNVDIYHLYIYLYVCIFTCLQIV